MQDAVRGFIALASQVGLNFDFLASPFELRMWLDGMTTTLVLVALTIPLSLAGGVVLAAALTSDRLWLAGPARAYVELTRNTPTLVQLMFTVLVVNMLISQAVGGAQNNPLGAYFWLVAVVSLHVAALHAEALRGGIEAVPAATVEAARGLGFSRLEVLRVVELPLALRTALPAIVNNLVNLVKLTTIGYAVAVNEITYASLMIWTQRDNVVELMIVLLLFFSAINLAVARIGSAVERRLAVPGYGQ
ncbi:amino acid ABC transporter permease [Methylobacterium aquaticum]|uniref:amino acid ABC transporter permease n=1 Tax=Methylobacterium aquaticum TaxID=270351 RepID=UPI001933137F|nr:amino acid ABC transporter permease [Methylobacterium aquaticum]QRE72542.1 amino acid ABC transporter permease [Methylobacterium aquaticum]